MESFKLKEFWILRLNCDFLGMLCFLWQLQTFAAGSIYVVWSALQFKNKNPNYIKMLLNYDFLIFNSQQSCKCQAVKRQTDTSMYGSVVLSTDNCHWQIFIPKEDTEVCLRISQNTKQWFWTEIAGIMNYLHIICPGPVKRDCLLCSRFD